MQPVPQCSAPIRYWQRRASGLLLHWELQLAHNLWVPPQLCCPLRFQNSPQTHWWKGFLVFGNFSSFTTPSMGQVSIPNSFDSLFIFYILSYHLSKRMDCLSGCLMSSASVQKLFYGICSAFKWFFDQFVGQKVIFPSYSFTILGQPPYGGVLMKAVFLAFR